MARVLTNGWELGLAGATGEADGSIVNGASIDTSIKRTGASALKCDTGALNTVAYSTSATISDSVFYVRVYVRFSNLDPSASVGILHFVSPETFSIRLRSGNSLGLFDEVANTLIGSASSTITTGVWYRLELFSSIGSGSVDAATFRLDGVEIASATGLNISDSASSQIRCGWSGTAPGANKIAHFDDFAMNNTSGGSENSWPGMGKIVLLKPISDNNVTNWTGGIGGTSNLYEAVNNTPPIGTSVETDSTQIESASNSGTASYSANLETYTTGGIVSTNTIRLIHPLVDHGEDSATGTKTGSFELTSNPTSSATTFTFGNNVGALGIWSSNWRTARGAIAYAPSVTLGSSPVLKVTKTDTTTGVASVDFMGAYVEFYDIRTHNVDAVLQQTFTKDHTVTAVLQKTQTSTHTVDAVLQLTSTKTHTIDAVLQKTFTITHTIDGVLQKTQTSTHLIESVLQKTQTATHTLDAVLQKTFTATHTVDAYLQNTITKTHTVDSVLLKTQTATHNARAVLQKTFSSSHTVTANIAQYGDTYFYDTGVSYDNPNPYNAQLVSNSVDAVLVGVTAKVHTVTAILLQIFTRTHLVDSVLQKTQQSTHTVDGFLFKNITSTHTVSAILQQTVTKQNTVDAILLKTQLKTHQTDSILRNTILASHNTDALIVGTKKAHTVDSVLLKIQQAGHSITAVLLATVNRTHSIDAVLLQQGTKTHLVDALLFTTINKIHNVTALLFITRTQSYSVDCLVVRDFAGADIAVAIEDRNISSGVEDRQLSKSVDVRNFSVVNEDRNIPNSIEDRNINSQIEDRELDL